MNETTRAAPSGLVTEPQPLAIESGSKLIAAGGVLAAIGASSCCVLPFALFTLGISGAWIGKLTALAPYQPIFVAAALAFLGIGFWRVGIVTATAGSGVVGCADEADLVRSPSVSTGSHPARGVAVSPLHAELPGR